MKILWLIYGVFTHLVAGLLILQGIPAFDAACLSLTTIATGGFTPHDPEARWSKKRSTEWDGYRLQITETAEELEETAKPRGAAETPVAETASAECADQPAETAAAIEPREAAETVPSTCPRGKKKSQRKERIQFITDIDVVPANADDSQATLDIERRLLAQDLKPREHIVDKGYVSGANLAHSAQLSIELVGPAPADHSRKPAGYKQRDFQLDFDCNILIGLGRCGDFLRKEI